MHRALLSLVLLGCGGGAAASPQPVTLPASSASAAPAPSESAQGTCSSAPSATPCPSSAPASSSATPLSGPKLCGCALCAPVLSDDPCKVDADCLPATPCHATSCVAAAHAQPRAPGLVCTQEFRCDTVDANRCACVRGRCAIAPK
ncbi:MAG TPA: hypothetical protein VLM85_29920 [Polyangiaceae bacterium]|nr:hypothetical protein [Polyangiaceae bacterium]